MATSKSKTLTQKENSTLSSVSRRRFIELTAMSVLGLATKDLIQPAIAIANSTLKWQSRIFPSAISVL